MKFFHLIGIVWTLLALAAFAPGCTTDPTPADDDDDSLDGDADGSDPQLCENNDDCDPGLYCNGGFCEPTSVPDGDNPDDDDDNGTPVLTAPTSVEFGAVLLGGFVERSVSLANAGDGTLILKKVKFDRATSDEFELVTTVEADHPLAPEAELVLTIRYTPQNPDNDLGVLEIHTNDTENLVAEVDLLTDYKGVPDIVVEPMALTFERTPIGSTAPIQCVSLSNRIDEGGNKVINITGLSLESGVNTYFEQTEPNLSLPAMLVPGSPKQVCFMYHPPNTGTHTDTLIIESDDPDEADREKHVSLSGEAVAGHVSASPTSLPFGPVLVDDSLTLQVTLSNVGLADLTLRTIGVEEAGSFTSVVLSEASAPWVLAPGGELAVDVTFAPTEQGAASGTLAITSDDPDHPSLSVALSGEGRRPSLVISPPQATFADTRLGEQSNVTLQFRRVASDVRITGIVWDAETPPFALADPNALPLDLNDDVNHPLVFVFSPQATADHLGNISAIATLQTEPVLVPAQTIVFGGKGIASEISVEQEGTLDFGLVRLGETIQRSFDVENTGTASLHVTSILFDETSHAGFGLVSPANGQMTVAAVGGSKGTVILRLTLTGSDATGPVSGLVRLASDDWDTPVVEIPLSAVAVDPVLVLTPNANPYNLGGVRVGTSGDWHTFQLSNSGVGDLVIGSVSLSPESLAKGFEIQNLPETFPVTLQPGGVEEGQTLTFEVRYTASENGVAEGVLTIVSNDYDRSSFSQGLRSFGSTCNEDTEAFCNGSCVSRFSVDHCGSECLLCEAQANANAACDGTQCTLNCQGTFKDCNNTYEDGCEVNTASDVSNCGACFTPCNLAHADYHCENSQCVIDACLGTWRNCDELTPSGCETDVISGGNASHCGACNSPCPGITNGTPSCASGFCIVGSCVGNFRDCDFDYNDGCEKDVINGGDIENCGSCGYTCPSYPHANMTCLEGGCAIASCIDWWRNCDGRLDNGCEKNTAGDIVNCGGCSTQANNYAFQCDLDHVQNHSCANGTCGVTDCDSGWVNLDGQTANGCECQNFGYDEPDDNFLDTNCDGLDGTISAAYFVATDRGLDTNPGTSLLPFKTIQKGIDAASLNGKSQVFIAAGTYTESLILKNGISLFGGYNSAGWSRNLMLQTRVVGNSDKTVTAQNLTAAVTLDALTLEGKDYTSNGTSTYTLWVRNVPSEYLVVRNSTLIGGDAGRGYDGTAGDIGVSGSAGNSTSNENGAAGGTVSCGANGGAGGSAWDCGNSDGSPGQNGGSGATVGSGGPRGGNECSGNLITGCSDEGGDGTAGGNGGGGSLGSRGNKAGSNSGYFFAGQWSGYSGNNGTDGFSGGGGGGGGAGGTDNDPLTCGNTVRIGGGGGGGGAGGCGGFGGTGGYQGGGSFAVVVVNSLIRLESVNIILGNAGEGGFGGAGGAGGSGRAGGAGNLNVHDEAGFGEYGGTGGDGGGGGGGAGGNGGPAIGIAYTDGGQANSQNVTFENTTAAGAAGGEGGLGGVRSNPYARAASGENGVAGIRAMTLVY